MHLCPLKGGRARREYRFAVKHLLVARNNEIKVVLHPAMAEMARCSAAYPYPVPVMQGPGYMGPYNYIRKPACDFGCVHSLLLRRPKPRNSHVLDGGIPVAYHVVSDM